MKRIKGSVRRIVFVSTYPPQRCGIATFSQDLLQSLRTLLPKMEFEVCAVNRRGITIDAYPAEVTVQIDQDKHATYLRAANYINKRADETLVIVQHEYGIYGGEAGNYLVDFMKALECPVVTTFHTVLDSPNQLMRKTTSDIICASSKLIVLTDNSRKIITSLYPTSVNKISQIGHGIHPTIFHALSDAKLPLRLSKHTVLLTFGLLGRNKGIRNVIEALPAIVSEFPDVIYLVVGGTHPSVLLEEGESYRLELIELAKELKVRSHVKFIDSYLPVEKILTYLQAADIYIAPSLDPKQAVSGTLSYALGAGCAIVASDFSQSRELIQKNVGRLVPIGDSAAISAAVIEVLRNPKLLNDMRRSAYESTRPMLWSNVADSHIALIESLPANINHVLDYWPKFSLNHLEAMTNKIGLLQFARGDKPFLSSGYTLDDNSRALQLVGAAALAHPEILDTCNKLAEKYLGVMARCLEQTPIANYLSGITGAVTKQNSFEDLRDSFSRAHYALQTTASGPLELAKKAKALMGKLPIEPDGENLRPIAFYLLGACIALEAGDPKAKVMVNKLSRLLVKAYRQNSSAGWNWFEPKMTYANGQLCASLLRSAKLTGSTTYRSVGLDSLDFLCRVGFMGEVYAPIGQNGWFPRGHHRALFDQQPEDVGAIIQALMAAYELTGDKAYVQRIEKAFSWFLGNNLLGRRMYDDASGGCHDGLRPLGPNKNEGAESTISYLQARLSLEVLS